MTSAIGDGWTVEYDATRFRVCYSGSQVKPPGAICSPWISYEDARAEGRRVASKLERLWDWLLTRKGRR